MYNCDKIALYNRAIPDRILCLKSEKIVGGKMPKDRLTVLCCSNADGSHKMPLFIVEKSKKPRRFRDANLTQLNMKQIQMFGLLLVFFKTG